MFTSGNCPQRIVTCEYYTSNCVKGMFMTADAVLETSVNDVTKSSRFCVLPHFQNCKEATGIVKVEMQQVLKLCHDVIWNSSQNTLNCTSHKFMVLNGDFSLKKKAN
ncbi:unnamed protein product [Cuscuta epithymum]|uniref:Uncharacterized protein n=1 Tax=Cuscuta epithymum TaxID=186058 RepID=A0AAV0D8L6_9ASTE|nr:unnamed protein product [Cuscuta epithymum]